VTMRRPLTEAQKRERRNFHRTDGPTRRVFDARLTIKNGPPGASRRTATRRPERILDEARRIMDARARVVAARGAALTAHDVEAGERLHAMLRFYDLALADLADRTIPANRRRK